MEEQKVKLFKDKYYIALYDLEDNFVAIFDNPRQLAEKTGKSRNSIESMLAHYTAGFISTFKYFDTKTKIYLIEA